LQGAHYPHGHLQHSFAATLKGDFLATGIPIHGGEWYEQAQDKDFWRPMVQGLKLESQSTDARAARPPLQTQVDLGLCCAMFCAGPSSVGYYCHYW